MEIITVTKETSKHFLPLIPEFVLEGETWIVGCVEGEEIISVAVVGVDKPNLTLRWIYTDEPQRNKGGARMLLEHLKRISDKHHFRISFSFEDQKIYTPILLRLCEPLFFNFSNLKISEYVTTKTLIKETAFYQQYKAKPMDGFMKLCDARNHDLNQLINAGIADAYEVSRADLEYSYLLKKDGEVVALLLAEHEGVEATYAITYLYVKEDNRSLGIQFLRNVMEEAFVKQGGVDVVTFQTVSDRMNEFMRKLLSTGPDFVRYFYEAEYDARLYEVV